MISVAVAVVVVVGVGDTVVVSVVKEGGWQALGFVARAKLLGGEWVVRRKVV
jgi:hypothetical protein